MTINFNTEPYNDDFSADNKFYRILFRPSFAVQARELTQLQTILQNQIQSQGNAIYTQGSMVIPGQISIDTNAHFVKLQPSYGGVVTESFIQSTLNKYITGSSGIKAQIIAVSSATASDPSTIFVKYTSSSTSGTQSVFADGEVITLDDGTNSFQTISVLGSTTPQATGIGSLASIERGIYYVNGFFVLCSDPVTGGAQTIVLDKYDNTPSYRVGLTLVESLIVPEDDATLLDNAQTSYNYAAPGAHRYHIDLILTKLPLGSTDDQNFIELLNVNSGVLKRLVNTTQYSVLEDELARRTFDEAGNYTVSPFTIDVREARNNNRGTWASGKTYLIGDVVIYNGNTYTSASVNPTVSVSIPPSQTSGYAYDGPGSTGVYWQYTANPVYNRGISLDGSDDNLAIGLEPGKAYVSGYEINKISTEYVTIPKCRDSNHQVQVTAATVPQTVGNYVLVEGINSCPPIDTYANVLLYNQFTTLGAKTVTLTGTLTATTSSVAVTGSGTSFTTQLAVGSVLYNGTTYVGTVATITDNTHITLVAYPTIVLSGATCTTTGQGFQPSGTQTGTARVRAIEWDNGSIGTNTSQYKLMLFDINMFPNGVEGGQYDFATDVKSFYYNNPAGGPAVDFTADIVPQNTQLIGSVTASNTTTITGSGTSFQTTLEVGDYVQLGNNTANIRRVTAVNSQNSITVDTAVTITGDTISLITTTINESQNETLLFQLPYYAVKSVRAADGTNRVIYTAYEKFSGTTTSSSGGVCTLTVSAPSGTMISAAQTDNYQVIDNTTGQTVYVQTSNISVSGSSVTFTLPALYASRAFIVVGAVTKTLSSSTEKTKTLQTATVTFTSATAAQAPILNLGQADGYRIISIKQADNVAFGATPTSSQYVTDLMDRYNFFDGQTAYSYELAYLQLLPSKAPPSAPIQVTFQYFSHGTGDYFTVNSYSGIDYKLIPFFGGVPLRDCIDFRSRKDSTGSAFTGSGGAISLVPKRGINIEADFVYYLARTDKIAIDQKGNFYQIQGTPASNPGAPPDPNLGMLLYTLQIEPYTFTTTATSVVVTKTENKRYTMRDIGRLENRINTLEYYTSLSLLEQQTQATVVNDPNTGLAQYKNGFVVDNFSGHASGDVSNPDYLCSIDMQNNILRPFYTMQNVNMIESNSTNVQRAGSNYQVTGSVITLPIVSENILISQPYGSRLENINPFAIYTFLGTVNLNPNTDDWFETNRLPDIINNVMGDFNTITQLAQQAGVLGTVWNAWQTQWTGSLPGDGSTTTYVADQRGIGVASWRDGTVSNTDAGQVNAMFGNVNSGSGWAHRQVTVEATAIQLGQSRTGVNTQVVSTIDTQLVNDAVLSQAVIPYIRSRNILIQASGLKPGTTLYPFFDNQDISGYCTPATKIQVSTNSGVFDTTSNVGGNTPETARQIAGDSQVCLNIGDKIVGGSSGATAIVVGTETILDTHNNITQKNVYVMNIIGSFQVNEQITGSISNAIGTVVSVGTIKTKGNSLTTDVNGKVQFIFNIPNTTSLAFRTGQRVLTLTDDATNSINYTTRGQATYTAQGILQTKQATYNAIQNGQLVQTQVTQNQTITQTSSRVVSDTGWYDPLAETFLISNPGGAFVTKVDLFFASKDQHIPVHIEIREVVNGYPGINIIPFSQVVLPPEQVNISTNTVTLPDGSIAPSYDTPTTFHFPSPVYLNDATSYALVVASDSNGYKVWCAQMGDQIPGSSRTISSQPYNGVLFKSQNGQTWTANQDEDLMFNMYYAQFDTSVVGNVAFVNDQLPHQTLPLNPFQTNSGSAKLKVTFPNHGFPVNSYVTLSNTDLTQVYGVSPTSGTLVCNTGTTTVTGTGTVFTTDIGVGTAGQGTVLYGPNNTYIGVVASVTDNTHLILVSNSAVTYATTTAFTITQSIGGIPATEVYKSNQVAAVVDQNTFIINTSTTGKIYGHFGSTTIQAVGHVQYNALQPSANIQSFPDTTANWSVKTITGQSINGTESPYTEDQSFNAVVINDNNYFPAPRMIASQQNENSLLGGNKSAVLNCLMTTTNPSLSPVLDTTRMSLIAISNVENSPNALTFNQSGIDQISTITTNTTVAFSSTGIYSTDSTVRGLFQNFVVGKYITISGATTHSSNNGTYLITGIYDDGTTGTITLNGSFTAQTAGDSISVVVLNAFVDEIAPFGSSSHSNYVTKKINLSSPATTLKVTMSVNCSTNANIAVYYKANPSGTSAANYNSINYKLMTPDAAIPLVQIGDNSYSDVNWTLHGLPPFDAFTVKVVMTSTNMAENVNLKDLRIIASS